ncbi:MAG: glycosyltransferase family 4 protein [Pirellulaceae bacterium]
MNALRLVLVTGRFWPLAADEERLLADLVEELAAGGVTVTVVTAQGHKSWPTMVVQRGVPIVRLPRSNARVWGAFRYQRTLAQWLAEHRREFDLVYVVGMRDEALAVLGAAGSGFPVVLRAVGLGETGDCQWRRSIHFGGRIASRCRAADAVVAASETSSEELRRAGFSPDRIELIADGVTRRPRKDAASQLRARAELSEVHPILAVPPDAPLVFYSGPIRENQGLLDLVAAWPLVLQHWPTAKLWLTGDATGADLLWNEIQQSGLTDTIILPGSFDFFDEILPAADVVVHAARESSSSLTVIESMAAGVPVVATRTPLMESLLDADEEALLTPVGDHEALAAAIGRLLADSALTHRLAEAAWRKYERRHTIEKMSQDHLSLFGRLVSTRTLALS